MSEHYSDDDVDRAAKALYGAWYEPGEGWDWSDATDGVRAILDAVAPSIAARALRDYADGMDRGEFGSRDDFGIQSAYAVNVRRCADRIHKEHA